MPNTTLATSGSVFAKLRLETLTCVNRLSANVGKACNRVIEFVVVGTPRSFRANSSPLWKAKVKAAVPEQDQLLDGPLRLRIDFFFSETTDLDTDNIIKPIQGALEDLVYEDDKTIVDVCARRVDRVSSPPVIDAPVALEKALNSTTGDFVYIRVAEARPEVTFS